MKNQSLKKRWLDLDIFAKSNNAKEEEITYSDNWSDHWSDDCCCCVGGFSK